MYGDVYLMCLFSFSIQLMMDYLSRAGTIRMRTIPAQSREGSSACHVVQQHSPTTNTTDMSRSTLADLDYLVMMGDIIYKSLKIVNPSLRDRLEIEDIKCPMLVNNCHYTLHQALSVYGGLNLRCSEGIRSSLEEALKPHRVHSARGGPSGQLPHKVCNF